MDSIMELLFIALVVFLGCWIGNKIFFGVDDQQQKAAPRRAAVPVRTIVHNCPFCGTPYDKWNRPGTGKLRICYHCKRNCYGDGSTVGLNEADRLQLQHEAEDCQRVASGTYDDACRSILDTWGSPGLNPNSLFTIDYDNIHLWSEHTGLKLMPRVLLHPPLKTFAGSNALCRRLHRFIEERLGDSAWMYHIDSNGVGVNVDDDFENAMKRKYQDT